MRKIQRVSDVPNARWRLNWLAGGMVVAFVAVIVRLFFIQVLAHEYYLDLADAQHTRFADIAAKRGVIYARDHTNEPESTLYPLAISKAFFEIYLTPSEITRPINAADLLSEVLGVDHDTILQRSQKENDPYETGTSKATDEQMRVIMDAGIEGIHARETVWRNYPDKEIGSHIIGFFGVEGSERVGKYGLEGYWQSELAGIDEKGMVMRDGLGQIIPSIGGDLGLAEDGADIVLSVDRTIQYEVCTQLQAGVQRFAADSGTAIVLETDTGAILAMCNYPSFDPNEYGDVTDVNYFNNSAVFEAYEPGSVFKPLSMAIAIDQGLVSPSTTYEDFGEVTVDGRPIKNFDEKAHGVKTMTEVLQESLNTGIVFATRQVPNRKFYDYIRAFGFGERTGVQLSQEMPGSLGELASGADVYKATASFGQGITVTPLQMVSSINALANGGILMQPYIVDEVRRSDNTIERTEPRQVRRVVSAETADTVSAMMIRVAEEGYDHKASIPGYYIAGKTGTAQIVEKGEYTAKTNHTFVGFGPGPDPRFTVLVKLSNVKNVAFASDSTTPIFNKIASFLVQYLKIPPNR
ncbi:MAG: penicillin-binding protein 2 [Patescibacteria group bacterium]